MTDPLLEVIIPADEATVFAALRYNDTDMVERLLRGGFDVNYRQGHQTEAGTLFCTNMCFKQYLIHDWLHTCELFCTNIVDPLYLDLGDLK